MTLLPFLAAVSQCCSRGVEKLGTLLSRCRCRWTGPGRSRQRPHCPAAWAEGQDTAPSSLCPDIIFRESVPRRPCPLGPRLAVAVPGAPPRSPDPDWVSPRACLGTRPCPHPPGAPPTRGPLQQGCGPAGHLPGHGPAAAAGFVDVVTVALQQSQACGLMTPTLVRGHGGGGGLSRGREGAGVGCGGRAVPRCTRQPPGGAGPLLSEEDREPSRDRPAALTASSPSAPGAGHPPLQLSQQRACGRAGLRWCRRPPRRPTRAWLPWRAACTPAGPRAVRGPSRGMEDVVKPEAECALSVHARAWWETGAGLGGPGGWLSQGGPQPRPPASPFLRSSL